MVTCCQHKQREPAGMPSRELFAPGAPCPLVVAQPVSFMYVPCLPSPGMGLGNPQCKQRNVEAAASDTCPQMWQETWWDRASPRPGRPALLVTEDDRRGSLVASPSFISLECVRECVLGEVALRGALEPAPASGCVVLAPKYLPSRPGPAASLPSLEPAGSSRVPC